MLTIIKNGQQEQGKSAAQMDKALNMLQEELM